MTMQVPLSKGLVAIIDDEDAPIVCDRKWYAHRRVKRTYAASNLKVTSGRKGIRRTLSMHREIVGAKDGEIVDHVNGDPLDNRRCNLRVCTDAQNKQNSVKRKAGVSRFKGVFKPSNPPKGRPWKARITVDGIRIEIGYYCTEQDAAKAYDEAATRHFGAFANLNFPTLEKP